MIAVIGWTVLLLFTLYQFGYDAFGESGAFWFMILSFALGVYLAYIFNSGDSKCEKREQQKSTNVNSDDDDLLYIYYADQINKK